MKPRCKHNYQKIENNYLLLGWKKCSQCGKEKYFGDDVEFTHFKFPPIEVK